MTDERIQLPTGRAEPNPEADINTAIASLRALERLLPSPQDLDGEGLTTFDELDDELKAKLKEISSAASTAHHALRCCLAYNEPIKPGPAARQRRERDIYQQIAFALHAWPDLAAALHQALGCGRFFITVTRQDLGPPKPKNDLLHHMACNHIAAEIEPILCHLLADHNRKTTPPPGEQATGSGNWQ